MSTPLRHEHFGPYKLIRPLGAAKGASRHVVLCTRTDTNDMLYRFASVSNHQLRRRVFDGFVRLSTLDHPHLLKISSVSYDDHGRLCLVTPYTGNHEGLVTMGDLLENRGGKLSVPEAVRAIEHMLEASAHAHVHQIGNGPISTSDVLIDRFGCLHLELYGARAMMQQNNHRELLADEIRSIVDLGYTMLTGLPASVDRLAPSRLVKRLDRAWDTWFEIGLDPLEGFESCEHAIRAMPTNPSSAEWLTSRTPAKPQVQLGAMLRRFKPTNPAPARDRDR